MANGFVPICAADDDGLRIALHVDDDIDMRKPLRLALLDKNRKLVAESDVLSDVQIGDLCSRLQSIYFKRTARVVWPMPGSTMFAAYAQALRDAETMACAAAAHGITVGDPNHFSWQMRADVHLLREAAVQREDVIDDDPLGEREQVVEDSLDEERTRYFVHPDSDCYFTVDDGSYPDEIGVEEIDKDAYAKGVAAQQVARIDADPLDEEEDEI